MYDWAFCVSHPDERILWDLGLDEVGFCVRRISIRSHAVGSLLIPAVGEQVYAGLRKSLRSEKEHRRAAERKRYLDCPDQNDHLQVRHVST
jgi:hypothetical protein